MRGSIEIKPSLCQQPRVRGSEGLMEREGGEAGLEGSAADRDTGGDGSIPSRNTKGCTRELTGLTHHSEEERNSTTGMDKNGEVENGGPAAQLVKKRTNGTIPCRLSHSSASPFSSLELFSFTQEPLSTL